MVYKLQFIDEFSGEACLKSFARAFSKSSSGPPRSAVALASAKHPFRRVLFCQAFFFAPLVSKKKAVYRFRYTMWVFLSTQSISCSFVRFFFWQKKRKRKSLAKRKARIRDFASAECYFGHLRPRCEFSAKTSPKDQRSARWISGRFWESDAKPFWGRLRLCSHPDKSKFEKGVNI